MMKKISLALAMICMVSSFSTALAAEYLGNPRSMKFHYTDCRTIKHPENFVTIESRDEAIAEGYVPCGVCNP
ncbi:nuclease [Megasphaera elsdenii]|uniref:nuclease n=1 Tax=Megasphaera elsdenii TaxID=907 RepID=UPI00242ABA35|nr:nuclease [Megasphaera elsdenii]